MDSVFGKSKNQKKKLISHVKKIFLELKMSTDVQRRALLDAFKTLGIIDSIEESPFKIETFTYPSGQFVAVDSPLAGSAEDSISDLVRFIENNYPVYVFGLAEHVVKGTITNITRQRFVLNYEQAGYTFGYYINPSNFWQVYEIMYNAITDFERTIQLHI